MNISNAPSATTRRELYWWWWYLWMNVSSYNAGSAPWFVTQAGSCPQTHPDLHGGRV
ncbi:hypothetical protein P170DRAFT_440370 [Aspergillus steynii IBT 23096]|uniref:Uncharacterized protein n=1 Tax=Aspergillus steynii IBT 23096 TaxID=1392250 RepID=A0A2I2FX89_9EURO|nr:uncharacterized protein P170DRAFT_440370 [Aspergillus steynii IBT 23096]PLB45223.1 hypothetical protein P170DRAFT_440370 [Aspergillus steynii IBT 23096]